MNYLTITHPLNGILSIAMGIGLGIVLTHRYKINWRYWWIGVFTFILSQVGHIPFNYLALNPGIAKLIDYIPEIWHIPLIAVLLGLSAGMFEEFARYMAYRWWIKDARTWSQGLVFGAGHGGLEAILVGALSLYTFAQIIALKGADLSTIFPTDQISLAQEQINIYWSMPWYDSLVGALERAFAIPLHLANAILVLQAFTRRQFRWVWLAVGLHTLVNALAVYLSQTFNIYLAELAIGIMAVLEIGLIFLLRRSMPIIPTPPPENQPLVRPVIQISEVPETKEKLEDTRFQ